MKTKLLVSRLALPGLLWTGVASASAAEYLADDFASGLKSSDWLVVSNTSLYTIDTSQQAVRFSKPADDSYLFKYIGAQLRPRLRGDFDVAVDFREASITRVDGSPGNQVQLNLFLGSQIFVLVRSDEAGQGHNIHVWLSPPNAWFGTRATNATAGRLRITRTGTQVGGYLDDLLIYSGNYNNADAYVECVLQNNGTRDATAVTFDNFAVTAENVLWPVVYFVEAFDGPLLRPAMVDRAGVYALAGGEIRCTSGRNYVRTTASDYIHRNFHAEVIYSMNGGGGAGGLFFGLGPADRDPAYYNEPLFSVFAIDHAQDFSLFQGTAVRSIPVSGQPKMFFSWAGGGTLTDGTNALRLIKQGDQLTWQMDHHYDEAVGFAATYSDTMNVTNVPFLDTSNSHLFFGTDPSPTRIREFRVIPNGGDWDAARDLGLNEIPDHPRELLNPNPTVPQWSYGYRTTLLSSDLTLWGGADHVNSAPGTTNVQGWSRALGPVITSNVGRVPVVWNLGFGNLAPLQPGEMDLHPGRDGEYAVVRWTAPAAGEYDFAVWWRDIDPYGGNGITGGILTNGAALFQQAWPNTGGGGFTNKVVLQENELVDFCLGSSGEWSADSTAFNAQIKTISTSATRPRLQIVLLESGEVAITWPKTAEGWQLEYITILTGSAGSWTLVPPPYTANATDCVVTEPAPHGHKLYRLHKP